MGSEATSDSGYLLGHNMNDQEAVVIIGAGPAGLTAAYQLAKLGKTSIVLEKDHLVGGISRTVNYKGYHFDIGGHRFFTKVTAVEQLWKEVLSPDEFLHRQRLSRIYYNQKFFHYPLKPLNAFLGLGVMNSCLIVASYLWARMFPKLPEDNFECWVSNRFGWRLYQTFFKTYTEKVWGMPAHTIAAEWAAQRIKGLSLLVAMKNAVLKSGSSGDGVVKTLIDSFDYPQRGPGMMWERITELVRKHGSEVLIGTEVDAVCCRGNRVETVLINRGGRRESVRGDEFISTMPLRELIQKLDPPAPSEVAQAAASLNYRDFLTVALILNKADLFPDNWIYIHDPKVSVGRIQNFKNWSPYMVPDQNKTCLGLEYFCFEGDGLWTMTDTDLIELGARELEVIGLAKKNEVEDGVVVRMPKAYPVYDDKYRDALKVIRQFLGRFENIQVVGRNGMHRYNNQDHSMLTAMLAIENMLGARHDLWEVNADQEYHEETTSREIQAKSQLGTLALTQPQVPVPVPARAGPRLVTAFARMDKLAFAAALGVVAGLVTFTTTLFLVLKGGDTIGRNMQLLSEFFVGYTVSVQGAMVGFAYSFLWAFLWGWIFAYLRNFFLGLVIYRVKRKVELISFREFVDHF